MKKESFIYSTLTIGGSKEQVNEVMKYICDDIYDIGSISLRGAGRIQICHCRKDPLAI